MRPANPAKRVMIERIKFSTFATPAVAANAGSMYTSGSPSATIIAIILISVDLLIIYDPPLISL